MRTSAEPLRTASAAVAAAAAAAQAAVMEERLASAVGDTLGRIEHVEAVLWADFDHYIGIVTILSDYRREAKLQVAEAELALMDEIEGVAIDFRMARQEDMAAYLSSGYATVFGGAGDDHTRPA